MLLSSHHLPDEGFFSGAIKYLHTRHNCVTYCGQTEHPQGGFCPRRQGGLFSLEMKEKNHGR
jgi:hypothetical protein